MKVGMTIEPFKGMALKQEIFLVRIMNLDHLEVNYTILPRIDEFTSKLGKMTTTFHLPIYSRFNFDLGSTAKEYELKINEIIAFLNNNRKEMNLQYILTHPPEGPDSTFDSLMLKLQKINSPILIENIIGQSEEQFEEFYFKAKDFLGKQLAGFALDAPHRFVNNNSGWLEFSKEMKKEIIYVHISDCTKTKDLHLPLGFGKLPKEEFFDFLKNISYHGIILQEVKPNDIQIANLMNSILLSIKPFSKWKYRNTKIRYFILETIIQRKINSALKAIQCSDYNSLLKEIAYDLI